MLTPDLSTDGDEKIPWNKQEAEADDKKENEKKHTGDGNKKPRLCWDSQRRGVRLSLRKNQRRSVMSNVAAVRRPYLRSRTKIMALRPTALLLS